MKRSFFLMTVSGVLICALGTDILAQRGRGGGGGGGRGGGGGGFSAPARSAPAARPSPAPSAPSRPSGGGGGGLAGGPSGAAAAPRATGTGPGGGNIQSGKGGGSYTTQGGSTINYKGAAAGGTTGGGVSGGKYVGGVQVTTPGGQTINRAGKGGAVEGPSGNAAAGRSNITGTTGPAGTGAAASRGGVATGPGGTTAGRAAVATGPGGTAAYRGGAAATASGTYYRSAAAVRTQGNSVVQNFAQQYPALAVRWAGFTYRPVAWAALAGYCGYPASESTSYDYGSSVVYQDDAVYVNGEQVATSAEYADQAAAIAEEGKKAEPAKDEEFKSLGVFAMVQGEETSSNNIFQLSISKNGVIRGEYYNALTDTTDPVFGSVDKKTQRAAWTVGDKKVPTYEAGVVNLTEDQATMMVHYSKERSQQMTLFRIEKPEGEPAAGQPTPAPKP